MKEINASILKHIVLGQPKIPDFITYIDASLFQSIMNLYGQRDHDDYHHKLPDYPYHQEQRYRRFPHWPYEYHYPQHYEWPQQEEWYLSDYFPNHQPADSLERPHYGDTERIKELIKILPNIRPELADALYMQDASLIKYIIFPRSNFAQISTNSYPWTLECGFKIVTSSTRLLELKEILPPPKRTTKTTTKPILKPTIKHTTTITSNPILIKTEILF
ncbi:unnamed protein product [Hymenolepis diminuta]|uniref:Uncharacterized protein n=1 Tax=Hymenolepis diminuta TaxID=6216 RepID=A0A3P6ZP91_HYMDI|nr:unnamed protein product [Hymenolepis diminuta]